MVICKVRLKIGDLILGGPSGTVAKQAEIENILDYLKELAILLIFGLTQRSARCHNTRINNGKQNALILIIRREISFALPSYRIFVAAEYAPGVQLPITRAGQATVKKRREQKKNTKKVIKK